MLDAQIEQDDQYKTGKPTHSRNLAIDSHSLVMAKQLQYPSFQNLEIMAPANIGLGIKDGMRAEEYSRELPTALSALAKSVTS